MLDQFNNVQCLLSNYSLDPTRASKDNSSNNEGSLLLEICKSNDLFVLNGRCGKDKGIGNFTFRNTSVIDYSIASAYALKYVKDFEITDLDYLYSDRHSLLSTAIKFKEVHSKLTKESKTGKQQQIPRWRNDKKSEFLTNIDQNKLSEIKNVMQNMHKNANIIESETLTHCAQK